MQVPIGTIWQSQTQKNTYGMIPLDKVQIQANLL